MARLATTRPQSPRRVLGGEVRAAVGSPGDLQISTWPALAQIEALAPALPSRWYSQAKLLRVLAQPDDEGAKSIFERSQISGRYLSVDERSLGDRQPEFQHRRLARSAQELAERAAMSALEQARVDTQSVGCLVIATSSGFLMPGLTSFVASSLGLPPDVCKYDLVGAGCLGALPVLSLASQYLFAHPERRVLGVCVDLGSQYIRRGETDKERLVVNSLFADACIGLVVGSGPKMSAMPQIRDVRYRQGDPHLLDSATVEVDDAGSKIARLHRELPERSASLFKPLIAETLAANGLDLSAIRHWLFHPGGRAVLDRLQADLDLPDDAMAPSRTILRQFGNASSPTCLLILHHVVTTGRAKPGDLGLLCAIGPGLTAGVALLSWPED
ncbi:MAG: hypothetical protein KGR26_03900 [Cyanobacteria bacterium REEB65]|nr:hypothetical protein [Cyanobacteria bacterium REEB65]